MFNDPSIIFIRSLHRLVALRGAPLIHQSARVPFAHSMLLTRVLDRVRRRSGLRSLPPQYP